MKIVSLAVAFGLSLAGLISAASAQSVKIRPECRRMNEPVACSCALDNGGRLAPNPSRPGRMRWFGPSSMAAQVAFNNCAARSSR